MAFTLKFGWTKDSLEDMPTPKYEGWKISREKVWNAKAGRSSKALYNGKIVAKKVTLDMSGKFDTKRNQKVDEVRRPR